RHRDRGPRRGVGRPTAPRARVLRLRGALRLLPSVAVSDDLPSQSAAPLERPSFGRLIRYFLGLGTWGFGGPIATVGYMQRDLVERYRWLGRQDFLNGVAL